MGDPAAAAPLQVGAGPLGQPHPLAQPEQLVPPNHLLQPANPCISGAILRGVATPPACPAFGGACTPEHPLGAPMVSSEGACAAYFRYRRHG